MASHTGAHSVPGEDRMYSTPSLRNASTIAVPPSNWFFSSWISSKRSFDGVYYFTAERARPLRGAGLAAVQSSRSIWRRFKAFQSFEPFNRFVHHGGSSVPGVPIVQSLCSVQNVSGILETSKCSNNQVGGRKAIEPLTLRNTRCRAPTAIFCRATSLPGLVQAVQVVPIAALRSSR